jgi:hypothetical protein
MAITRDREAKNWVRPAANRPFTAVFDRIFIIFHTDACISNKEFDSGAF